MKNEAEITVILILSLFVVGMGLSTMPPTGGFEDGRIIVTTTPSPTPAFVPTPIPTPPPAPASTKTPYEELQYNETTLATVSDFMSRMPDYTGGGQCVSRSRYVAFQANEHNLTILTCIVGGSGSAQHTEKHQVNTFTDDGVRYYTSNLYIGDERVLTGSGLLVLLNETLPSGLSHLSPRDFWTPVDESASG